MNSILTAALLAIVLWTIWQQFQHRFRCGYCGKVASHEQGCPWNIDGGN